MTVDITEIRGGITDEGESADLTATLVDTTGATLEKAAVLSLTMTLMDESTLAVINSRNAVDVLDDNGGTLADDGTLTLRLDPEDAENVNGVAFGKEESHLFLFVWTWNDGVKIRTGSKVLRHRIAAKPIAVP